LIKASIEGVHQADPNAQILLQLSISFDPAFALAFYQNMRLLGVEYDIAGLSFYPSAFGPLVVPGFCETIDRLGDEMGLPVVIPEFGYPAEIPAGGPFANWYNELPGYPLTQEGQARWIADFLASLQQHPNVIAAYYFSPAFHWGGDIWGAFALFDQDGRARLGVGALTSP
jgi:arabinogalactan endo-1,4-beta-galactosidase